GRMGRRAKHACCPNFPRTVDLMPGREQESLASRWRDFENLPNLTKHWYWRPGWQPGRSFYTWHLTFAGQAALHQLVRRVQAALDVPGLDLVALDSLHLTMQGVGFTNEVDDVDAIAAAAAPRCAAVSAFRVSLGPVDPDAEGVGLLVSPWAPIQRVRDAVRDAIGSVRGDVPEPAEGFRPHVTVAYS